MADVDLNVSGAPSLLMRDLSEIMTLAYLGPFEAQGQDSEASSRSTPRMTYIALTKGVMPMLLEMFVKFKDYDSIYLDETVEIIFSVSTRTDPESDGVPHIFLVICCSNEAEVRMPTFIKVRLRSSTLENSDGNVFANSQRSHETPARRY